MGKRSSFERIPRDFCPTPRSAVLPLIPHLRVVRTFAEPCCGDGTLVRRLEGFGLRCAYAGDIATGQDALAIEWYGMIDAIVTTRHTAATAAHSVEDAPQDRTEDPAGDDIHIDGTCAQYGLPGGNEVCFSDGPMIRLHRECETPYRRVLDEGQRASPLTTLEPALGRMPRDTKPMTRRV